MRLARFTHHPPSLLLNSRSRVVLVSSNLHAKTGIRVRAGIGIHVGICVVVQSSRVAIRHGRGENDGVSDYRDNVGSC